MEMRDCFVIMPFSKSKSHTENEWTEIFEAFFKPAWDELGIECYRIKVARGSITKEIIEKLYSAWIVFADLTDSNPNVMYELGVRHTFRKPSVMVKAKGAKIPFDVKAYNVFEYEYTPRGLIQLKDYLNSAIMHIQKFPNKADNPVWDFHNTGDFLFDYYRNMETFHKLQSLTLELNDNARLCRDFLTVINDIDLSKDLIEKAKSEKLNECARNFFPQIRNDALTHFQVTRYIEFEDKDWRIFKQIDDFYRWCRYFSSSLEIIDFTQDDRIKIFEIIKIIDDAFFIIANRTAEIRSKSSSEL